MHRLSLLLKPLLWLTLIAVYVLAVMPQGSAPQFGGNDKVQHVAAFFMLALLAALAMPRVAAGWIVAGLALFGAAIEITQTIPSLDRDAELADWLADVAAIAAGLLAAAPFRRRIQEAR